MSLSSCATEITLSNERTVPVYMFSQETGRLVGDKGDTFMFSNLFKAHIHVERGSPLFLAMVNINPDVWGWIGAEGITYHSTQAVWESLKAETQETFDLFHSEGLLGSFQAHPNPTLEQKYEEVAAFLPFYGNNAGAAERAWQRRRAKSMVGIIAKLAVNRARAEVVRNLRHDPYFIGLADINPQREYPAIEDEREFWINVLLAKFSDPTLKELLLATGNGYLLELDYGALSSDEKVVEEVYWGGFIPSKGTHAGVLRGTNTMGKYLMRVRSILRKGKDKTQ